MGGGRGPSLAYYVPSLSAMQLFVPLHPAEARTHAAGQVYRLSDSLAAKVHYLINGWGNSTACKSPTGRSGQRRPIQRSDAATYAYGVLLCSTQRGRVS